MILGPDGEPAAPGEEGEICYRDPVGVQARTLYWSTLPPAATMRTS